MSRSLIRGITQILPESIDASLFVSDLNLPTSQLADGANFVKKDCTVAFTAAHALVGFNLGNAGLKSRVLSQLALTTAN